MKQQKSGAPHFSLPDLSGFHFPFGAKTAKEDPIDELLETFGKSVDDPGLIKSKAASTPEMPAFSVSSSDLLKSVVGGIFTKIRPPAPSTGFPELAHPANDEAATLAEDSAIKTVPGANHSFLQHLNAFTLPFKNIQFRFSVKKHETETKHEPAAAEIESALANHFAEEDAVSIVRSPANFLRSKGFLYGAPAGLLCVVGLFLVPTIVHRPHLIVKPSVAVLKVPSPRHALALTGITTVTHLRSVVLGKTQHALDGKAAKPSEVIIPVKEDASLDDAAADTQVIAEIRPQIHHLCGLAVSKVIGWNYRDGYLFCHIRNHDIETSNILQRDESGNFTFIGGSLGFMSASTMSNEFLLDQRTANLLLANMKSEQG